MYYIYIYIYLYIYILYQKTKKEHETEGKRVYQLVTIVDRNVLQNEKE